MGSKFLNKCASRDETYLADFAQTSRDQQLGPLTAVGTNQQLYRATRSASAQDVCCGSSSSSMGYSTYRDWKWEVHVVLRVQMIDADL